MRLLLIHPHIINVIAERELRIIGLATVGADGEIEEKVMFKTYYIVGEGILRVSITTLILSLREVDFVQ